MSTFYLLEIVILIHANSPLPPPPAPRTPQVFSVYLICSPNLPGKKYVHVVSCSFRWGSPSEVFMTNVHQVWSKASASLHFPWLPLLSWVHLRANLIIHNTTKSAVIYILIFFKYLRPNR